MRNLEWSKEEKQIARAAFDRAMNREAAQIIASVKQRASAITTMKDVWDLSDHLNDLGKELAYKYDYRYSQLIWIFIRLIHEQWIALDDLAGLGEDKLVLIRNGLGLANRE